MTRLFYKHNNSLNLSVYLYLFFPLSLSLTFRFPPLPLLLSKIMTTATTTTTTTQCLSTRKLSQADLEDLLDPQVNFLPLFQDLNPGFESLYSPYSPNLDSSSTTDTSSPPNSHYEDMAVSVKSNLDHTKIEKFEIYPLKMYSFRLKMQRPYLHQQQQQHHHHQMTFY